MNATPIPLDRAAVLVRRKEQAREAMQHALAEVVSGADFADADAVLDHLSDLGMTVAPFDEQR